ncbi:MAG: AbrB/MazE/SpoVT family DNA-binding domain-containing protein [Candidatus Aenigmarchaeota archaeon]|nr:AbrB/MazE/SpoVT family DNA-binding domain-containing protein [Candidatus Aenigmarchaeota archaeon]
MKKVQEIPDITRMSSKGQIVIPRRLRDSMNIKEGEMLAVMSGRDSIVLKKIDIKLTRSEKDDIEAIEKAMGDAASGKLKALGKKEFLRELAKWGKKGKSFPHKTSKLR